MDLTRRQTLLGAAASFAASTQSVEAAKQYCPVVPDAAPAPACAEWVVVNITDPAVTSWTVPAGVSAIQVQGWGAGAGGGTIGGTDSVYAGGGGAYTVLPMFHVVAGQVFPVQVGRGGAPDSDGQATTFGTEPLLFADGGYANGDGGLADNCIPLIEPVVGASDYYAAQDGGGGGICFVGGIGTGWNPDDATAGAALNGGPPFTYVTFGSVPGAVRSTISKGSGKLFFEVGIYGSTGTLDGIGICTGDVSLATMASVGTEAVLVRQNGNIYVNGTAVGSVGGSLIASPVSWVYVSVAVDVGAKKIWFQLQYPGPYLPWNNNGSANPATGVGGIDISSVFTGKNVFGCLASNTVFDVDTSQPTFGAWWSADGFNSPSDVPGGFVAWDNPLPSLFGAGGGGAAGWMQYGGQGDNNGEFSDTYSGGGGSAQGAGNSDQVLGQGGQSWDLTPGGVGGGVGGHGSGGGGGTVGGRGGTGIGVGFGTGVAGVGPGGGGGGGTASGAGGAGGMWGGGGGAGNPGGVGANGALSIAYVLNADAPCDVVVTPGGPYNITLADSNGYIYYSVDSGASWFETTAYPPSLGFVRTALASGFTEGNMTRWAYLADSCPLYPMFDGFYFPAISVVADPITNMVTQVPIRFDNGDGTATGPVADELAYSPNQGLIYIGNFPTGSTGGGYFNLELRYSVDHGLTWGGLTSLTGQFELGWSGPRGWHNVCFSHDAQTIYVKEWAGLIHKSTDRGVSWHMLATGPLFTDTPDSKETVMCCSQDGRTILMLSKFEMQLWISHDGGVNWITHYIYSWVPPPDVQRYAYSDTAAMDLSGNVMLVEAFWVEPGFVNFYYHNPVWLSKNGGLTWTEIFPPTAQMPLGTAARLSVAQVRVSQDGSGLLVAYYPNDDISTKVDVSLDTGVTWSTHTITLQPPAGSGINWEDGQGQWEGAYIWS